jgi:hypothetical protein
MSDVEPPMPELEEGNLDAAGLESLLRDVGACADLLEVILKGNASSRAATAGVDLGAAKEALMARTCRAAQLRYRYAGVEWWDTVLVSPTGWRVVRIRQDRTPP